LVPEAIARCLSRIYVLQCRPEKQSRIYGLASISRRCRGVLYDALYLKGVSFSQTRLTRLFGRAEDKCGRLARLDLANQGTPSRFHYHRPLPVFSPTAGWGGFALLPVLQPHIAFLAFVRAGWIGMATAVALPFLRCRRVRSVASSKRGWGWEDWCGVTVKPR